MRNLFFAIAITVIIIFCNACSSADGNNGGTEYMPDMYHSIAYEANLDDYYYYNTWGSRDDYYKIAEPRKPVNGTIPRGYANAIKAKHHNGTASLSAMAIPMNGSVPYYYKDTEEERTRAMNEIINNPFPITDKGLEDAKFLYETFCGICHGNKGDGNGYLVDEKNLNAVYPAQPANFLSDEFVTASNGRYYHAVMHGKNVMGGYADKLSYEERWQVIHYIRSLQAKDKKLVYSEKANTLNTVDIPKASPQYVAQNFSFASSFDDDGTHHHGTMGGHGEMHHHEGVEGHEHDGGHGHGHGHEHSHDGEAHSGADAHNVESHAVEGKKKEGIVKKAVKKGKEIIGNAKEKRAAKKDEH